MSHTPSPFSENARLSVLMVDDELDLLETWSILLELEGFVVLTENSADAAFKAATAHLPSLVITDFRMAGTDGLELCKWLKSEASTRDIPIIMWTGTPMHAHDDLFERVAVKPVTLESLLALIRDVLD